MIKPFWEITTQDIENCLKATTWYSAITKYFRGGGYSSSFLPCGNVPMTMYRLDLVKGLTRSCRLPKVRPLTCPKMSITSLTNAPTPPGPPTGSCRTVPDKALSKNAYGG